MAYLDEQILQFNVELSTGKWAKYVSLFMREKQ